MVRNKQILEAIARLERKVDLMDAKVEQLLAEVTTLEGDATAIVAAVTALVKEVGELKAGTITEAEVESVTAKVTAVAEALKAATPPAA